MSKFSAIVEGPRARKQIKLPLPGARINPKTFSWEGPFDTLDIRALANDEYTDVLVNARAFAKERKIENPDESDPVYERGKIVHTLAITCIDKDSPESDPQPYFDGGWEQLHTSKVLLPEILGYLYFQQKLWQDEVNPLLETLDPTEFMAATIKLAGGDMDFFVNSRPGMLWSYLHSLARQHLDLLARKSLSSGPSEAASETKT